MCVNNLFEVALDSAAAGIEPATSSRKSNAITTTPPSQRDKAMSCIWTTEIIFDAFFFRNLKQTNKQKRRFCVLRQKTESKVWTVQTVIRSCTQQCNDVGTHLIRAGYDELPTTIAAFVHCCSDRDLCNTAVRRVQNLQQTVVMAVLLALFVNCRPLKSEL